MSNAFIIFIYSIAVYGLSNMVVFGSGPFRIFERIRALANMVSDHFGLLFGCMMCFPANIGWIFSLLDWFLIKDVAITPFNIFFDGTNLWWLAMILDCCFTSGIVWIIHYVESFFESIAEGTVSRNNENSEE